MKKDIFKIESESEAKLLKYMASLLGMAYLIGTGVHYGLILLYSIIIFVALEVLGL